MEQYIFFHELFAKRKLSRKVTYWLSTSPIVGRSIFSFHSALITYRTAIRVFQRTLRLFFCDKLIVVLLRTNFLRFKCLRIFYILVLLTYDMTIKSFKFSSRDGCNISFRVMSSLSESLKFNFERRLAVLMIYQSNSMGLGSGCATGKHVYFGTEMIVEDVSANSVTKYFAKDLICFASSSNCTLIFFLLLFSGQSAGRPPI